jgi:hypothetical protein
MRGQEPCGWDTMIQAGIAIQELDLGYWWPVEMLLEEQIFWIK